MVYDLLKKSIVNYNTEKKGFPSLVKWKDDGTYVYGQSEAEEIVDCNNKFFSHDKLPSFHH